MRSRRRSIEERTEEILQRNRSTNQSLSSNPMKSEFEDAYRDIMAGLSEATVSATDLPPSNESPEHLKSPDSFDLSAADFEPGLFAARRKMEKAAERGRRMAFDQEMFLGRDRIRDSISPDLKITARRSSIDSNRFSTALSSIQFSDDGDRKDTTRRGFSSPDPSDNEIYNNLLQITPVVQNEDHSLPGDDKEYEDDFEVEPSMAEATLVPPPTKVVSSEMATVEQIMQRWYSMGKESQTTVQSENKKSPEEKAVSKEDSDIDESKVEPTIYGKQLIEAFSGGDLVTSIPLERSSGPHLDHLLNDFGHSEMKVDNDRVTEDEREVSEVVKIPSKSPSPSPSPYHESEDRVSPLPEPVQARDPTPNDLSDPDHISKSFSEEREVRSKRDTSPPLVDIPPPLFTSVSFASSTPVASQIPAKISKSTKISTERVNKPERQLQQESKLPSKPLSLKPLPAESEKVSDVLLLLCDTVNQLKEKLGQKTSATRVSVNFEAVIQNLLEVVAEVESKIYSVQCMEQSVALQESVLQSRERMIAMSREKAFADFNDKILSLTREKAELQQQLHLQHEEVSKVMRELNLLKATRLEQSTGTGKRLSPDRPVVSESSSSPEINVEGKSHEELKNEFLVQERLIASYQKENERLTKLLKDEELRAITNQAQFYDKQEETNRELNRLRNITSVSETFSVRKRKSAEELRIELEQDGKIRFLQEKVGELEEQMVQREKEFRNTINRYKQQCQELQLALNRRPHQFAQELEAELHRKREEVASLKKELEKRDQCYTAAEAAERQLLISRREVAVARRQLSSLGATVEEIDFFFAGSLPLSQLLVRLDERGSEAFMSTCLETYKKKIRSLEKTIESLNKSLKDKRPDSVGGLIRAVREPPKRKEEDSETKRQLEELKEELRFKRESYEISLSELRLQHERVVTGMKERIAELTNQVRKCEEVSLDPSSSLRTASNREDEVEKIRKFYIKKLEQMHSRHEKQIQAMKRNSQFSDLPLPHSPVEETVQERSEVLLVEKGVACRPSLIENESQTEAIDLTLRQSISSPSVSDRKKHHCAECQTDELPSTTSSALSRFDSNHTTNLEKRIVALEANINERERTFYRAVQQVELSAQIEKQLLQSEFQKEILAKDQRIQEFEAQLQLLLTQLSVIKQRL